MKASEYNSQLLNNIKNRDDIKINKYKLNYKKGNYEFLRISSNYIKKKDKIFLIRAGIHGEEIAGPLSILQHINEIIDYAHENNIKLIIYPLGNPSGFENNLRYNIDNDKGEDGNNDFIRFELKNGEIVADLGEKNDYRRFYWAIDKKAKLPKETELMQKILKKDPIRQVKACLDLHQDYITPKIKEAAYHYSFGNLKVYDKIIENIEKLVPVLKNENIGAGFSVEIDNKGKISNTIPEGELIKSDNKGFIVRYDGSLPTLLYLIGTEYCVTVETTGKTSLDKACKVNLIWIKGIIDILR
ncbi:MAG: M14 family zinc carboxypeptidase [Nanoarchaeota archaeon]